MLQKIEKYTNIDNNPKFFTVKPNHPVITNYGVQLGRKVLFPVNLDIPRDRDYHSPTDYFMNYSIK